MYIYIDDLKIAPRHEKKLPPLGVDISVQVGSGSRYDIYILIGSSNSVWDKFPYTKYHYLFPFSAYQQCRISRSFCRLHSLNSFLASDSGSTCAHCPCVYVDVFGHFSRNRYQPYAYLNVRDSSALLGVGADQTINYSFARLFRLKSYQVFFPIS